MKKLLIISFAVILSFGFTFSGDSNKELKSDCPYLNKIHSSAETIICPYLDGKVSQKELGEMEKPECPYSNKTDIKANECPYLKNQEKVKSGEIIQPKVIKLKAS